MENLPQGGIILNNSNSTIQTRISEDNILLTNDNKEKDFYSPTTMLPSLVPAWPKDTFETKFDDREDTNTKLA